MESTADYPLAWTPSRNVRTLLDDMAPASVGKRLKTLRERKGLTQDGLADLIGVKERTVSRWETGASRGLYDDDVLDHIAAALSCSPEDIIGPRAVPPAELADVKDQLTRVETELATLKNYVINTLGPILEKQDATRRDQAVDPTTSGSGRTAPPARNRKRPA